MSERSLFVRAGLAAVLTLLAAGVSAAGKGAKAGFPEGMRFDSLGVLDLASWTLTKSGEPIALGALDAAAAADIRAAKSVDPDELLLKFSDGEYGCKTPSAACTKTHEAQLIAATDGTVKRLDNRLVIAAAAGKPIVFQDWTLATTKTADGDGSKHLYLGRMAGNGYHRVEVQFEHDAPGNFLINPQSGKIAFVHNAADLVSPSPDDMRLVTFNTLNPPLSIRVGALDAAGPRVEMICTAREHDDKTAAAFKGWHDASSFDLIVSNGEGDAKRDVALRATHGANGWSIAAADAAQLNAIGFACR